MKNIGKKCVLACAYNHKRKAFCYDTFCGTEDEVELAREEFVDLMRGDFWASFELSKIDAQSAIKKFERYVDFRLTTMTAEEKTRRFA